MNETKQNPTTTSFTGWYWPEHGGYRPHMHRQGPMAQWSLCGASRLGTAVDKARASERRPKRAYARCANCLRLDYAMFHGGTADEPFYPAAHV